MPRRVLCGTIGAAKRLLRTSPSQLDHASYIEVHGETGLEDRRVVERIMAHIVSHSTLRLAATNEGATPQLGEWFVDAAAPKARPRIKVLLRTRAEVDELVELMNGTALSVGGAMVGELPCRTT